MPNRTQLQLFDAVNEWADIISFLGKLLKSFQAYPQFKTIPHKQIVSKRLAQCLNPGFPAGVHQKTLEVYAYILETIGKDQLAEDLPLWSLGLFPFVQYAATHVKPQLLNIFEKYFYPLGTKLRPAIRGYIIALLPALEEEGSEVFHKVVSMLDRLTNVVDLPFFYSCIWLIMINDTNLRSPCLNYLLLKLPKITNKEDVALVLGGPENLGLMVRAFSATLMDHQLLVQRGILELLVQNYSLQYRTLGHEDLVLLMRSAISIVLRKDMSLNRRLYGWLLGSDSNSQNQLKYFHLYSEKAATQAIRHLFFMSQDAYQYQDTQTGNYILDAQKPYKILISLMDKWEIGQPIVNNVFTDSLVSLQRHSKHESIEQEILQTANMWMEIVDPYLIWKKLFNIIDQAFPKSPKSTGLGVDNLQNGLKLVEYTLKSFKLTDEEIKQFHLPLVLAAMTKKLRKSITYDSFSDTLPQIIQILEVMIIIICQLPDSVFLDRQQNSILDENSQHIQKEFHTGMDVLDYAREFYGIKRNNEIGDDANKNNNEHKITLATNANHSIESAVNISSAILQTSHTNDMDHSTNKNEEDEGDLTNQSSTKVVDSKDILTAIIRPDFGPIRGTILLKELSKNMIQFLVKLVDNYIIIPEIVNSGGVDVGVDGKRLYNIDKQLEKVLHRTCQLLSMMAKHIDQKQNNNIDMDDQEQQQLKNDVTQVLLKCCQQSKDFGVVDIGLDTLSQLIRQQRFLDGSSLKKKENTNKILDKLWFFLAPSTKLLHMRTAELIWLLTDISIQHHVETIVANYLIIPDDNERVINYEKFGVFWELSENMVEASTVFSRPMFLMLDLLKDGITPLNRRAGETWIRCHLKSYARLMEPFITTLLNQNIIRRPIKKKIPLTYQSAYPNQPSSSNQPDATVDYFIYMRSFDMDIIDYLFTTLISLVQFGGIGVLEACRNYTVGNTGPMPLLIESGLGISTKDYPSLDFLELLVHIAIRFLESEPCEKLHSKMVTSVRTIQLHASELLYLIISKLDYVDMNITSLMQQSVVKKLLFCITSGDLDIQQKLLHLLHATMAITSAVAQGTKFNTNSNTLSPSHSPKTNDKRHHRRQTSIGYPSLFGGESNTIQHSSLHHHHSGFSSQNRSQNEAALLLAQSTSNLYVKCVIDAFHTPSNRPILQHWIDFVLITLPYVRNGFRQIIVPILICLCEQINLCNATVRLLMHGATADKTSVSSPTTNEHSFGGDYWHLTSTAMYDHHDMLSSTCSSATQPLIQERGAVIGGPETDILMFLNGLEKLLRYGLIEKNINDDWSITKIVNDSFSKDSLITTGYLLPHVENHDELWGMAQLMMQQPGYNNNQILMNSSNNNSSSNLSAVTLTASSSTGTSSTTTSNNGTNHHSTSNHDKYKSRNALLSHLPVILHILLDVWRVFRRPNWSQDTVNIMGNAKKEAVLQSFAYAADHVKARLEYTLEKLYESCPIEVIEGFVEIFFIENPIALEYEATTDQFELNVIEVLTNIPSITPQQILTKLLESIRQRTPGMQHHRKRHIMRAGKLTDTSLLRFTEIYCQEIIKPETLASLWPSISPFVKEYLSQASTYKTILPGLLRYMTIVVDRFVSFSDDRKARKDAQDLYQRCVDYCILIAGKSFDQSLWSRRTNIYDDDQQNDTYSTISSLSSPYPSTIHASDVNSIEHLSLYSQYSHHVNNNNNNNNNHHGPSPLSNTNHHGSGEMNSMIVPNLSTSSISELEKKASWKLREDYMILHINHYIATHVIPQLRHIIGDQDKINSLLNNLVYYVIGPHLRSRPPTSSIPLLQSKRLRSTPSQASLTTTSSITTSHPHSINTTSLPSSSSSSSLPLPLLHSGTVIIDQLVEMSKMPFTYKTWRKEVWEVFSDARFFYMTSSTANKWSTILSTVFSLEKERFTELMGKITTSPSNSAFFTNKDQETLQRALHLRRVSFVIFAGSMNQYVPQLPTIQEKMVELLKLDHNEMIHVEIYLCLRIILIRFSQKHLIHFWPVLISEMIRVFNSFITNESLDRPEEAQIALAGCKFLDLLCTLEMDSFQVYQWIFIRDTVDAVIKREETQQVSMMSKLSHSLHKHCQSEMDKTTSDSNGSPFLLDRHANHFKTDHHGNNVVASSSSSLPSVGELKRPMLTMHSIGSIVQLSFFIEHLHLYVYQSSYMLAKPDMPFIESLLLQDLLEGDMRTD
ncbi:unnamed protein product [Cunninghamella blakesleeana]